MRRFFILLLVIVAALSPCFAQQKLPQVRTLETKGWKVQHSVMSWDSLSIYFAAKEPGKSDYDLYVLYAEGWRWGEPQRIDALSTAADEMYPSISGDEQMLFYEVRNQTPDIQSQIWRAWYRNNRWQEAAPLIISSVEDAQPKLLEDNMTLVFKRREQTKKHDGAWLRFTATMMDDHNWTLPMQVESNPAPQPILAVSGTIVRQKGNRPLADGKVLVYDATNEQLLQTAYVHPMTGRWRIALQQNKHYRLALTAPGYSYHYIDIQTDGLTKRETRDYGSIALDDQLVLNLTTYDAETQVVLTKRQEVLSLGQIHTLNLSQEGYKTASLTVNTERPTVFTQTELDIPLQPLKRLHRFVITDARTNEAVEGLNLRLNGQPTAPQAALRINQEQTLQLSAPGYIFFDTLFNTGADTTDRTIAVRLLPIEKNMVLQLRNIQFEYDSYELTESSNDELEALAQLLFMNPTLRIELSSHTDDQGSDRYNDRLSTLRGKAVEQWLKERGIEADRIETVGYGKRKPLVANDSEEHRALNRRVEIKVIDF